MGLPATKNVAKQQIRKYTPHREIVQAFIFYRPRWANLDHEEDFRFPSKYRTSSPVLYIGQIVALKDVQDLSYEVPVFCLLLGNSDTLQ